MAITLSGDSPNLTSASLTTPTLTSPTLTNPTFAGTPSGSIITSGTAVASTSGTSIDFTSIPSWVKRITVNFTGVSTSGTSPLQIQLGAGSAVTTGYLGSGGYISTTIASQATYTSGFVIVNNPSASAAYNGFATINLLGSNTWCESSNISSSTSQVAMFFSSGSLPVGGTLDRVRITTVNGTDTFDAGSINILYE